MFAIGNEEADETKKVTDPNTWIPNVGLRQDIAKNVDAFPRKVSPRYPRAQPISINQDT